MMVTIPTLYVGAYGFRDSDALGRIWAKDPQTFAEMMKATLRETAEQYAADETPEHDCPWDECECNPADLTLDNLWYVGPFAQSALATLRDLEEKARQPEMIDDLRTSASGYVY